MSTSITGCSGPYRTPKALTWQEQHYAALYAPTEAELPLVAMLRATQGMISLHGSGQLERENIAAILLATRSLLSSNWGTRLDRGTVDGELIRMASCIDFDLDTERFS
jgi:hypothetical protein